MLCVFLVLRQLLRGAPDSLLRSLHVQKDPTAYNYIKVGGQIKVLFVVVHTYKYSSEYVCLKTQNACDSKFVSRGKKKHNLQMFRLYSLQVFETNTSHMLVVQV